MKHKIRLLLAALLLAPLASPRILADSLTHYYVPSVCAPPLPPQPGQPGYGPDNPLSNGVYFDYNAGLWVVPDGLWQGNGADRDTYFPDYQDPPPAPPAWALWPDMEPDGTYYFPGGTYLSGHYFAPGFYWPYEIW